MRTYETSITGLAYEALVSQVLSTDDVARASERLEVSVLYRDLNK